MEREEESSTDTEKSEEIKVNAAIRNLSLEELDRDLAEIACEIDFLEAQLSCDLRSYSPEALMEAREKISRFKKRAQILDIELGKRKNSRPVA